LYKLINLLILYNPYRLSIIDDRLQLVYIYTYTTPIEELDLINENRKTKSNTLKRKVKNFFIYIYYIPMYI